VQKYIKEYVCRHHEVDLKKQVGEPYHQQTNVTIPQNTIVHNVYCDYENFLKMPKSDNYRGIYVYRDPRELIVSFYYSWKLSHGRDHPRRAHLHEVSVKEGFMWTIDRLIDQDGIFNAMVDWVLNCQDPRFKLYKFENFFKDDASQKKHLREVFNFFDIKISSGDLDVLNRQMVFKKLSKGRQRGDTNIFKHYRSGIADSFRTELPKECLNYFYKRTGNLIHTLGYED